MSSCHSPEILKPNDTGTTFLELRRKIQDTELLSTSSERLLQSLHFTGRLTIVVHNGRVLKCGYEEGYFRRKDD